MSFPRGLFAGLASCVLLAVTAAGASADSTIGPSSASLSNAGNWSTGTFTLSPIWIWGVQSDPATETGTVTTWRIRTNSASGTVQLLVLHPSGGSWKITTETSPQAVTTNGLNVYSANLPIQAGDTLAVTGASTSLRVGAGTVTANRWQGKPTTVGTVLGPPALTFAGTYQLGFNADVTVQAAPAVTSIATTGPTAVGLVIGDGVRGGGLVAGGGAVVRGANMNLATSVYFNDVPATQWWIDGFEQISVVVPPGLPAGPVTLRVGGVGGVNEDTPGIQVTIGG